MKNIEKIIGIVLLIFAIGFNLWLYRLEPTAVIDPNDNTFQFGLVDRTNTIWGFATRQCSGSVVGILTFPLCHFSYLADHWVPNWAQGYNLPYYYSHIPQIMIVGTWRIISSAFHQLSLFQYYHVVIYLLLCFFPLPMFLALRVIGLPWLTAGVGALLATHLSTDGLYGLDPSSFLWRGYGLSSQLFAMVFLPLAIAYSFRFFMNTESGIMNREKKSLNIFQYSVFSIHNSNFLLAVFFTVATTAGHLGIGMITFISLGFLAISQPIYMLINQQWDKETWQLIKNNVIKLVLLAGTSIFVLSYWIIPTLIHDNYHNISFWDPVWKFDSYGWQPIIGRLWNGELFDFGRVPILTYLIFIGAFACLADAGRRAFSKHLSPFFFLFIFWLVFYFGRVTWGGLIDLIPGMKEYHLSRFLVGLHIAGMFLVPIGIQFLADYGVRMTEYGLRKFFHLRLNHLYICIFVYLFIGFTVIPPVYNQTLKYNELNDRLIIQANDNRAKTKADEDALFAKLRSLPPGRIYAGRGATYGKRFSIAETPVYMHLSTYGLPTVLWLPETWSMNSDTEQYFSDDQVKDYNLYNIRYVAAPADEKPKEFWKYIDGSDTWKLYEVPTTGYFTTGVRPAIVSSDKQSFVNLIHLWIQSDFHKQGLFPELTFDKNYPKATGLPNFKMVDEVTYKVPASTREDASSTRGGPDGSLHNIFAEPPKYMLVDSNNAPLSQTITPTLIGPEKNDTDMSFSTKVSVPKNCTECIVVLKQTFVPGWKAYIDGKPASTITVFPFFIGVPMTEGTHDVMLRYEPSRLKIALLVVTIISSLTISLFVMHVHKR
jgi:Bacterial membrane protein YfhO